ncbi:response regulator transcription factor [Psychroflexus aestuariivivens]|uniref:response regulator transcription factor n=1 Tax=Psychroflexus aestuariivivens TaxID=1795040 RepID=UPI000FD98AB2|nr:response regulator transcription factor [Psychroflexus aestuariivivens]
MPIQKKLLIVEDHLLTVDVYQKAIALVDIKFETIIALGLSEAHKAITNPLHKDVTGIILDLSFKTVYNSGDAYYESGVDLLPLIERHMPKAKVLVVTASFSTITLKALENEYNLRGVLIKCDMDLDFLIETLQSIDEDKFTCTPTYRDAVENLKKFEALDHIDLKILQGIYQNKSLIEIASEVALSLSAIKKRKAKIKDVFGLETNSDFELLKVLRANNFIDTLI